MKRVRISIKGLLVFDTSASIGVGTLIMFVAMILVASMTASVLIQTMNSMQQQAMLTGQQTIKEISSGLKVTHVSGKNDGTVITRIAIFVDPVAGSGEINLSSTYISLSNTAKQVILNYTKSCFSSTVSNGLFTTLDSSRLSSTTYGILVIRDVDSSCSSNRPGINSDDLVVLLVNTTTCFSGLATRTDVYGKVIPEAGINGVIGFTTPSAYVDIIVELQP